MTGEIEIRDRRNGQWAWVNNSVIADPHLTPAAKVVYAALASFAGYQEIKPSVPDLAGRCSLGIVSIPLLSVCSGHVGRGGGEAHPLVLLRRP